MLIMPALNGPDSARESLKASPLIVVVFVWVYHGRFINIHMYRPCCLYRHIIMEILLQLLNVNFKLFGLDLHRTMFDSFIRLKIRLSCKVLKIKITLKGCEFMGLPIICCNIVRLYIYKGHTLF